MSTIGWQHEHLRKETPLKNLSQISNILVPKFLRGVIMRLQSGKASGSLTEIL